MVFLMDTKWIQSEREELLCTLYPKLEIKSKYRRLLEHLYVFYCLFLQIESEFPVLELLLRTRIKVECIG